MTDPFADARNWRARAQAHIDEFGDRTGRMGDVWSVRHQQRPDGTHVYTKNFDHDAFQMMKIVVAEAANALFQSLDHIVAVGARTADLTSRNRKISWPWKVKIGENGAFRSDISKKIDKLKSAGLPDIWCKYICSVTDEFAADMHRINALKDISLDGKHWKLVSVGPKLKHIGINIFNPKSHITIPIPDQFFTKSGSIVIWEGAMLDSENHEIVSMLNFVLDFDGNEHGITAFDALDAGSRFVSRALEGATDILAVGTGVMHAEP